MLKKIISLLVSACLVTTTTVCQVFSSSAATAMEYGRAYQYYVYENGASDIYVLYGQSTLSSNSPAVCAFEENPSVDTANTAVVKLKIGSNIRGSGFIVDNHTIATAAHCLYNKDTSSFVTSVTAYVYSGSNFTTPVATLTPKSAHINYSYTNDAHPYHYDYGLLYFEEDLSQYGVFSMGVVTDEFLDSGTDVTISGFPVSVPDGSGGGNRYYARGAIANISELNVPGTTSYSYRYELACYAYASGGDSGGPMYINQTFRGKAYKTVIGIVTSVSGNTASYGTRITSDVLNFYYNNENIDIHVIYE